MVLGTLWAALIFGVVLFLRQAEIASLRCCPENQGIWPSFPWIVVITTSYKYL